MARSIYDAGGMMRIAADIRSSMKNFSSQRKKIDDTVSGMRNYFSDPVHDDLVRKYDALQQDLKKAEDVMREYADLLSAAAELYGSRTVVTSKYGVREGYMLSILESRGIRV